MLLADRGTVDPLLILNTLFGGLLAAAGARTSTPARTTLRIRRPLVQGLVGHGQAQQVALRE